ncbi:MAG: hypothetical protein HC933_05000 [Pleurocapsa sp. SU_196_0]|nr:hypothetical protein [Pleurocapsa sp. SU_196_0]
MTYKPQIVTERSRGGAVVSATAPASREIKVLMDFEVTVEKITPFGDPSKLMSGKRAIFRILASDLEPKTDAAFEFHGVRYSILSVLPLRRGGKTFKYDALVGFE